MDYTYKTQPYEHQRVVFELSRDRETYALFMEMGTGKTKVIIDTAAWLYQQDKIGCVIVMAPNGICHNWGREVGIHCPTNIDFSVHLWSDLRKRTIEARRIIDNLCQGLKYASLKFIIINIEAMSTNGPDKFVEDLCKNSRPMMVIDESTTIKSPSAKRTKKVISFGRECRYKRIMTGTPMCNGPMDIFSQFKFLDPNILGFGSFYTYRARYALLETKYFGPGRSFTVIRGYQRIDELMGIIKPHSTHILKSECLDLPDKIFERRDIELMDRQKRAYLDVLNEAIVWMNEETYITIDNALTKLVKLHQITSGWLKYDDGTIEDLGSNKINELLDILEDNPGKAIIWAHYRGDIGKICQALGEKFGKDSFVAYFGDISATARVDAVKRFQEETSPVRFFVGNPQTGGFGLTLTVASTVIYYSNSFNLEHRLQSEDRAHRIGQKNNVTYVDLVCRGTVDEQVYDALRFKQNLVTSALDVLRELANVDNL